MYRYKLIVEYNGTPFCGWQRQSGVLTVQQCLEEAVQPLTKDLVLINGAGRTDTGVHALGQVAHFETDKLLDAFRVQECMNAHLAELPISVLSVEQVDKNFHSRFSAVERYYIYKIVNRRSKLALDINRAWKVLKPLNEEKMNKVAQILVGKHDFSAFRATGCQSNSPVKTLNSISVERFSDQVIVKLAAKSFLYHQVRNIVGSLQKVGTGEWSVDKFQEVFESKDRTQAAATAPACGLYFWKVRY
ncbi:MAG: tRNA pseudouridine(38-40) synthase TruA [Alphaproteobacteria bacterium]|nr:tRNA pseudouridine(38-40) synthase TruA [Alphaproteobacteria bacterium]MCR4555451.1 tRNA pseudouridine(38-40) synthase TruA [Alphaproteobacteria bacterium]